MRRSVINFHNLPFSRFQRVLFFSSLLLLVLAMSGLLVNVVRASTTIDVNTHLDVKKSNDRLCSLREAIIAANTDKPSGKKPGECKSGNGADTIRLDYLPGDTAYILTRADSGNENASETGDLDITDDLTITGGGANQTLIGVDWTTIPLEEFRVDIREDQIFVSRMT